MLDKAVNECFISKKLIMKNRNLPHSDNCETPKYIYDEINEHFDFNFDPCPINHDIKKWDGLKINWGERCFVNPPYSKELKNLFIIKAVEESKKGKLCVMLLPVSTSTKIFHDIILENVSQPIKFFKRRIKFVGYNSKGILVSNKSPMHDSMLCVFDEGIGSNEKFVKELYRRLQLKETKL